MYDSEDSHEDRPYKKNSGKRKARWEVRRIPREGDLFVGKAGSEVRGLWVEEIRKIHKQVAPTKNYTVYVSNTVNISNEKYRYLR